jgi:hypothetical protein
LRCLSWKLVLTVLVTQPMVIRLLHIFCKQALYWVTKLLGFDCFFGILGFNCFFGI